jgi:hypothetical protein
MAAWFGIVAVAQLDFTLFHSNQENRASFIASTLTMKFMAKRQGVLCQEGARAPCCTRDEGGPFGAVL